MQFSHVEVDGKRGPSFLTDVKVILLDESNYQRHVKITHEGIFVDLIDSEGEVVAQLKATANATADEDRLRYLAGCGGEEPVIEGFGSVLADIYEFVGDATRLRIGDSNDSEDWEPTDDDKLAGFRALIDAAIEADRKANHV